MTIPHRASAVWHILCYTWKTLCSRTPTVSGVLATYPVDYSPHSSFSVLLYMKILFDECMLLPLAVTLQMPVETIYWQLWGKTTTSIDLICVSTWWTLATLEGVRAIHSNCVWCRVYFVQLPKHVVKTKKGGGADPSNIFIIMPLF